MKKRRELERQEKEAANYKEPFPTQAVPRILRERCEYASRKIAVEIEATFLCGLAAVGYAAKVERPEGGENYLNVPCATSGPSSSGKSPARKVVSEPFSGVLKLIPTAKRAPVGR